MIGFPWLKILISNCSFVLMFIIFIQPTYAQSIERDNEIVVVQWNEGDPDKYLIPEQDGICFLSSIGGKFRTKNEILRIWSDGSAWYIGGKSNQNIHGQATCVLFEAFSGIDDGVTITQPQKSIYDRGDSSCAPWPLCGHGIEKILSDSSAFCYITGVGGQLGSQWYTNIDSDSDANVLFLVSNHNYIEAEAGCIKVNGHLETRYLKDFRWNSGDPQLELRSISEAFCAFTRLYGSYVENDDTIKVDLSNSNQVVWGSSSENDIGGWVSCMYFEQTVADLHVSQSTDKNPTIAGTELIYIITIENKGPETSKNALMEALLIPNTTIISAVSSQGSCIQTPSVICQLGNVGNGEIVTVNIRVAVEPDFSESTITNQITATSESGDPDLSNNTSTVQTEIIRRADLVISDFAIVNPPPTLYVGEETTIRLATTVRNDGPSSPVNSLLNGTPTAPADSTAAANTPIIDLPGLASPRTVEQTYRVKCGEVGAHKFTFTADIAPLDPDDVDPDLLNNRAIATLDVECIFKLDLREIGWHLISMPVIPHNAQIGILLNEIAGGYAKVLSFEAGALAYVPTLPGFSNFSTMDGTHGYWIYMEQGGIVNVHGQPQPQDTPIALERKAGTWSVIYPKIRWRWSRRLPRFPGNTTRCWAMIVAQLHIMQHFNRR
ncbi:MAG: DUF11 domain-containing protein [Caldilineaceae bacterium]